jgi:hypothetical protein
MSLPGDLSDKLIGLGVLLAFIAAWTFFLWLPGMRPGMQPPPAISNFLKAIGAAIERGRRLHLSTGHGEVTSPSAAASFAALGMLHPLRRRAAQSDLPTITTSGAGELALLAQPGDSALSGPTPLAYAAGALSWMADDDCAANLAAGRLGGELALLIDAAEQQDGVCLAGSDAFPGQAALYACSGEGLIGEDLFAASAYLDGNAAQRASLHAQDVLRWLVILAILAGIALRIWA